MKDRLRDTVGTCLVGHDLGKYHVLEGLACLRALDALVLLIRLKTENYDYRAHL
jgi:hypothetical protein